jgi:hypothetical protein
VVALAAEEANPVARHVLQFVTALVLGCIAVLPFEGEPAFAVGGKDGSTDWPCPQRKVDRLGPAELQWAGPPPEPGSTWRQNSAVAGVVKTIASRRTSLEEATAALKSFAQTVPAAQRTAQFTLVFTGLLETVNDYRSAVIGGIERFNKRQKSRSQEIETEGAKLNDLEKKAAASEAAKAEYEKALELYEWNTRVFDERRQNLPLACEIPPSIDGRTFEVVRELQALMGPPG